MQRHGLSLPLDRGVFGPPPPLLTPQEEPKRSLKGLPLRAPPTAPPPVFLGVWGGPLWEGSYVYVSY